MPSLIISYRRSDSDVIAGRIRDRLVSHFGNDSVFMDIDSIPFGLDFREHIKQALLQNDVLLAIIGPNWFGQHDKGARIFDETDPVRIEVETALHRNIPVIPVLVGGATMPQPSELPDGLKDLAFRNAAIVDGGRDFHQHMDRLIRSTDALLADKSASRVHRTIVGKEDAVGLAAGPERRFSLGNWVTILLGVGFLITLAVLAYVMRTQNPSLSQMSQPAAPIEQSTQRTPQTEPASTTAIQEAMPAIAPKCNPANRPDLFSDNFKTSEVGWLPPVGTEFPGAGKITSYENGGLSFKVPLTRTFTEMYTPLIFESINASAHIKNPADIPEKGKTTVSAGIAFWSQRFK